MTDKEIVEKLIEKDPEITHWFFYEKCRPLFVSLIKKLFKFPVEYDEFVNEVVVFLLEEDAYRLKQFDYKSSIYLWLRTCLIRHFIRNNNTMIDGASKEPLSPIRTEELNPTSSINAKIDLEILLNSLSKENPRYAYVLKRLMLEDADSQVVAQELNVLVSNLYNIKKRAIAELIRISLMNDVG